MTAGSESGFDVDAGCLEVETGFVDEETGFLDVETGFVVEAGCSIVTVTIFVDVDVGFRDVGFMGKGSGFHLSDVMSREVSMCCGRPVVCLRGLVVCPGAYTVVREPQSRM